MNLTLPALDTLPSAAPSAITHVVFRMGRDLYALPAAPVQFLTLMPLGGAGNLQGETVDAVEVRARLGLPAKERSEIDALILVVTYPDGVAHRTALIVDEVEDVIEAGPIKAPAYTLRTGPDCLAGTFFLRGKEVTLLDLEALLSPEFQRPSLAA